MSSKDVTLLIMPGGEGGSEVERLVGGAREAVALDLIDHALKIEPIGRVIVATPSATFAGKLGNRPVEVELLDGRDFQFGLLLWELIEGYRIEKLLYFGGGSGPLLSEEGLASLAELLLAEEEVFLLNNFYSADFAGLAPAQRLLELPPPPGDNRLGWLLWEAEYKPAELPRTAATQFDIDTPTDLSILKMHPAIGENSGMYLGDLPLCLAPLEAALDCLVDREATLLAAGRVPSYAWRYLEEETACQVRVFSEERGMKASGREGGGARSLLGFYLQEVGPRRFFGALAEMADLVLLDSRVLFSHFGRWPGDRDRFWSDLLRAEEIEDPVVRELTEAAKGAPIPVVLGGHSLVSGGLYALVEIAWQGRELERRVAQLSGLSKIKKE